MTEPLDLSGVEGHTNPPPDELRLAASDEGTADAFADLIAFAEEMSAAAGFDPSASHVIVAARSAYAADLKSADAEIGRLNAALRYEENRSGRIGTHGPGCWAWGPSHYECLKVRVERLEGAINKIASCESHHPDDVVSIARAALPEEPQP